MGRNLAYLGAGIGIGILLVAGIGWATAGSPLAPYSWMSTMMGDGAHGGMMQHGGCGMMMGACGSTSETGNATTVVMQGTAFHPTRLTVPAGAVVTWTNRDGVAHTVTSDSGQELDSGTIAPGASWSHRFVTAGTYTYHCQPHAGQDANGNYVGMVATVVVT